MPSSFTASPKMQPTENQQLNGNESKSKTWVYIWNMTSQGVGHAAIQIEGDSQKMTEDQPGEYVSIHPKNIPAIGPTIILPLPAELSTTLSADMESEAASKHGISLEMNYTSFPIEESLRPDQTFEIEGLDTQAMKNHIREAKNKVKSKEIAYQLLPKVNFLGFAGNFFQNGAAFISHDPIDIELHRRSSKEKQSVQQHTNNCATFVSDILNIGGMHISQSKTPWGLTPNGLADQLDEFRNKMGCS